MIALIRMISGLAVWAVAFSGLYALHGLGCSLNWTGQAPFGLTWTQASLLAMWGLMILVHGLLIAWLLKQPNGLMDRIGIAIGWIGLGATVFTGLPMLAISSCL